MAEDIKSQEVQGRAKEKILSRQKEDVRAFDAEEILKNKEVIGEKLLFGLDLVASILKQEVGALSLPWNKVKLAKKMEMSRRAIYEGEGIPIRKVIRTALVGLALPPLNIQLEDPTPFEMEESRVADTYDWWGELSESQREAFWQVLKDQLGLDLKSKSEEPSFITGVNENGEEELFSYKMVESRGQFTIPAEGEWPENKFVPILVFYF